MIEAFELEKLYNRRKDIHEKLADQRLVSAADSLYKADGSDFSYTIYRSRPGANDHIRCEVRV